MKLVTFVCVCVCSTDLNIATLFQKYCMNVYSAKAIRKVCCCKGSNPVVADVLKDKLQNNDKRGIYRYPHFSADV